MKKIGFIDYFLDEWHANNYPSWIADPRHSGRYEVGFAWAAIDKPGGLSTGEWCTKYGVVSAASQEKLIEKSDCIVVLSPDNPEQHEALTTLALKSGKPVYVDKTFAVSLAAAERMFNLAEKHNTPVYSTSALRYAEEFKWLKENNIAQVDIELVSARGPSVFENYAIHQIEMIVASMGTGSKRAIALNIKNASVVMYEYANNRCSIVNHLLWSGFSLALQDRLGKGTTLNIQSNFWDGFIDALLHFFDTGVPAVPRMETCETIAMYEAGAKALLKPGAWIDIP